MQQNLFLAGRPKLSTVALLLLATGCSARVDLASERQNSNSAENTPSGDGGSGADGASSSLQRTSGYVCPDTCTTTWFRANADSNSGPVSLAPGEEAWYCFGSHVSLSQPMLMTAFIPLIDNTTMLHDMALNKMSVSQTAGGYSLCPTVDPNATLVYEWAPGTNPETLSPGSQIPFDPGDFQLRVHYRNVTNTVMQGDTSGIGVCVCPM